MLHRRKLQQHAKLMLERLVDDLRDIRVLQESAFGAPVGGHESDWCSELEQSLGRTAAHLEKAGGELFRSVAMDATEADLLVMKAKYRERLKPRGSVRMLDCMRSRKPLPGQRELF